MKSVRCVPCGLVNFADAEVCKRCRAPLVAGGAVEAGGTAADEAGGGAARPEPGPRVRSRRVPVVLALGALVLAAAALSLLPGRAATAPPYADLIRVSEPFSQPMTMKVNQRALPDGLERFSLRAVPEAFALEHLGLLRIDVSRVRVEVEGRPGSLYSSRSDPPETPFAMVDKVSIALTAEGREAAAGWEVSSSVRNGDRITWWHVPVGRRELVSVGRVGPGPYDKGERELRAVNFKWRWVPNEIGQVFDRANAASADLPARARHSYLARFDSAREYDGLAWFGRKGEAWELVEVFCNVHFDQADGKFYPVADTDPYGF